MQLLNTQLKVQQHQNAEQMRPPTFNHVGPLGPVQHPHQSQLQHDNLMKVLQVQQVSQFEIVNRNLNFDVEHFFSY